MATTGSLISLDPKTKAFKVYTVPRGFLWNGGLYPHTVRVVKSDIVWFTGASQRYSRQERFFGRNVCKMVLYPWR